MLNKYSKFFINLQQSVLPVITVLLSIFIPILPFQSKIFSILMPLLTYIAVYFWNIYRPNSLSYVTLFILGLIKDIIENSLFGLNTLCLLLFSFMVKSQRKYIINRAFMVIWAGFVFFFSIIFLISIILLDLNTTITLYPVKIVFAQWLITTFTYVPIHFLLNKLNYLSHEQ